MPKVKINPNAKAPEFVAVIAGEYPMKFERVEKDACKLSEKGNWMTRMRLVHLAPNDQLTNLLTNQPLKATELAGSVFVNFMMGEEWQGTLRQAIEATGGTWPTELEFDGNSDTEVMLAFANWIQQQLDQREVQVRLKTSEYQGNWKNEVQRFITPEVAH